MALIERHFNNCLVKIVVDRYQQNKTLLCFNLHILFIDNNSALIINDPKFSLDKNLAKPEFMVIVGAKCAVTSFSSYYPLHPRSKGVSLKA